MQRRSLFYLCVISKKFFKKKIGKISKPGLGSGQDGSGLGLGSWQGSAGLRPHGRRGTHMFHRRYFESLFLPPPLSGAPRRTLVVDAASNFLCRCSALASLKPCHLCSTCFWCSLRREHFSFFSVCARFRSPPLLLQASFSFFALHCALNCEVCLCILSANYGGGFRVCSIHVFAFSIVLVNAIVHVHVYLAFGSHSAILNAGCDGLGHHCTVSTL